MNRGIGSSATYKLMFAKLVILSSCYCCYFHASATVTFAALNRLSIDLFSSFYCVITFASTGIFSYCAEEELFQHRSVCSLRCFSLCILLQQCFAGARLLATLSAKSSAAFLLQFAFDEFCGTSKPLH